MTGIPHPTADRAGAADNLLTDCHAGAVVQAGHVGTLQLHTPRAAPPPPRQLLPVPRIWTDRCTLLRELDAAAADSRGGPSLLVAISGVGGVGKTALATKWLSRRGADTPDGQLYADLTRPHHEPAEALVRRVLRHFLRSVGHDPGTDDVQELAAWWRSASHGHRFGILLDNAQDAADVLPLLPGDAGHLIVVTSRPHLDALTAQGALRCELPPLTRPVAERLLVRIAGQELARGHRSSLRTIASACSYLPLALIVAATSLSARPERPISTVARELDHAATPGRTHALVPVLEQRYDDLPTASDRQAYRLLSVVPLREIEADAAANICQLAHPEAASALRTLAGAGLLERLGPRSGRGVTYRFHDAVKEHAQQLAQDEDGPTGIEEAMRRCGAWLLATSTRAERILTPHHRQLARDLHHHVDRFAFADDDHGAALRWVEAHLPDVTLTVYEARRQGWHVLVWQLVHATWPAFHYLRPMELSAELHRLGAEAAEACGDREALREMLTTGVIALRALNRVPEAAQWAARALTLAREDGDIRSLSQATHELGVCARAQGGKKEARQYLFEARVMREENGDCRGAALTRIVEGQIDLDDGQPNRAIDRVGPAHVDLRSVGDTINAGRACLVLAEANSRIGSSANAVRLLDRAEDDFQHAGSPTGQARVLRMRGHLAERDGDTDTARTHYTAALALYKKTSPHDAKEITALLDALPEQPASTTS
ncbi:hypothetical protein [Streptomyces silvensis]|uniref:NB-ARC domain-containing protein n=1 Tax=Streptomyces silvensis TaxID=1765722 RepID=A0A0W7XB58_9ACTN|nr:hypothetical protein [Streptomyces silvensis]KUF20136.1 hypothetical protein AT728_40120 [Streptomyces silvensis]